MYHLSIVTPEKVVFEDEVISVIAPGTVGYLEVLTDHAPIITSLQIGKLTVTAPDKQKLFYAISGGFMEVSSRQATILADAVTLASEIDLERAKKAREQALKIIQSRARETDIPDAVTALKRADNRIRIYHEHVASRDVEQLT
jgi:F-type H+-transporting ATPase subunit epsilon